MALLYAISPSRCMRSARRTAHCGPRRGSRPAADGRMECRTCRPVLHRLCPDRYDSSLPRMDFRTSGEKIFRVKSRFFCAVTSKRLRKAHCARCPARQRRAAFRSAGTAPRTAVRHSGDHHGRANAGVRFSEYRTGRNAVEQRLVAPCVAALDIHAAREQNAQRMRGIADAVNRLKFVKFKIAGVQTAQKRDNSAVSMPRNRPQRARMDRFIFPPVLLLGQHTLPSQYSKI